MSSFPARLLCLLTVCAASLTASVHAENFNLRGYGEFSHALQSGPVNAHSLKFSDPALAAVFVSKIFSDFELSSGNQIQEIDLPSGKADLISLAGQEFILPLLAKDQGEVTILIGSDRQALAAEAARRLKSPALRRSQLTHPQFMDKWDRYCMGMWYRPSDIFADPDNKTPETFFPWFAKVGLNPQIVDGLSSRDLVSNDNVLRWLRKYLTAGNVRYQSVEWLQAGPDLYNRNPFLSSFDSPSMVTRWSYYGEVPHAPNLLRDVQHEAVLKGLEGYGGDPNLMALVGNDGEIGPFDNFFWGEYGPVQTRNFVRYLRDVRKFSLSDVSQRYYGNPDALKSWDDLSLVDWRTFYGWNDQSQDLAGEWRFMRDDNSLGLKEGWQQPAYDDSDWIRLYYPGDTALFTLVDFSKPKPYWMRRTFHSDKDWQGRPVYLTVAPLTEQPVQVFVNGQRVGSLDPRYHTGRVFGQFDVSEFLKKSPDLLVALRFTGRDLPSGPVFLTDKPLQDFPTDDPKLNARRYDHMDFMDWAVADSVKQMLRRIRSIEPDRPLKVHAYEKSPWGWKTIHEAGGYSHHTGSGAGWYYTAPKQYGLTRGLQDSSETGGSMDTPRDIKGLMGSLSYMGKNAHDYFHDLQSITKHPGMREWLTERLPTIRIMGRANVHSSPIAAIRGLRNINYLGEFLHTESWRQGYNFVRGGEMMPLLDEIRVGEGNLPFAAIVDEGTLCWDADMTAALKKYVEEGGVLFLQVGSGRHTPEVRDAGPGPELAGVKLLGDQREPLHITISQPDLLLGGLEGKVGQAFPHPSATSQRIQPLEGTTVVGTTSEGDPAITRRALGKGQVYYCAGGTWPKAVQDAILSTFGSKIYATSDTAAKGVDLIRTARSNNGSEELLMLRGLGKEAPVSWTLDFPPSAICNAATGEKIPAQITGNTASFTVSIPDWDLVWLAARRPSAEDHFDHWLQRQSEIWGGVIAPEKVPDLPLFRWLDLNREWKLVQTDSVESAQKLMSLSDEEAGLKPTDLVWWSAPGMNLKTGEGVVGLYRRDFDLSADWNKNASLNLTISSRIWAWPYLGFEGPSIIFLNGQKIWEGDKIDSSALDVTAAALPGKNRLEIIHQGRGILANIALARTLNPDQTIDLAGEWHAVDGLRSTRKVKLPGQENTSFVYRDITVPAEAAGQEVWLRLDTENPESSRFVIINGRTRYPVVRGGDPLPLDVNITPEIRFGETNRILIGTQSMYDGWKKAPHNFRKMELRFFKPGRWSADGKGIRDALTPRELADVEKVSRRVGLYPMVQNLLPRQPINPFSVSETEAAEYQAPEKIVDLVFAPDGQVHDDGTLQVPVTAHGQVSAFTERGGRLNGLAFRADGKAFLTIPQEPLGKAIAERDFTITAWVKPLLDKSSGGQLLRWHHMLAIDLAETGLSFAINSDWPQKIQADSVLQQRGWHFIAVTMEGNTGSVYVDGLNVGSRTWPAPIRQAHGDFFIGSAFGDAGFLNMRLAAFTIFPGALPETDITKLYLQQRARFLSAQGEAWPEDTLTLLDFSKSPVTDIAEFPAQLELGPGTTYSAADHAFSFDGQKSSLLFREHDRVHQLAAPFSLIIDIKPAPGAEGCIFRRYHDLGLWLRKDGSLMFDANIGKKRQLLIPPVVVPDEWNRLMLTYDGNTFTLFRNGERVFTEAYPGQLSQSRYLPLSVGADNTHGPDGFTGRLKMQLRELTLFPGLLDTMPPAK